MLASTIGSRSIFNSQGNVRKGEEKNKKQIKKEKR